jgi:ribonuclease III
MLSEERIDRLRRLEDVIDYRFRDILLLNKALTHKSYVNEKPGMKHNERFEFLGDSVLDLVVSDFMVKKYDGYAEGALSKIRAAVVNETCLADLARRIDLGDFLLLGKGEEQSKGREKSSLLANSLEAVAGAVYFDGGLESAVRVFLPLLQKEIENYAGTDRFEDYKSDLQEFTQNRLMCVPVYKVVRATGPDHDKRFEVTVSIKEETYGVGNGKSKKEAEQAAAQVAIERLNRVNKK